MYKKLLLIICIFLLFGCNNSNINTMTLEEIVKTTISSDSKLYNTNSRGYMYYLPNEFSIYKEEDFINELISHNTIYYMNVDAVSYHYKNLITTEHYSDDYEYFTFENDGTNGYLKIRKNNDYFFVELCYNYAIIEVEVKDSELRYAVSRAITILKSIKYNDLVIEKYISENDLSSSETVYKIPEPKDKNESKNILQYINDYEEN